jgi:hypothetical protein
MRYVLALSVAVVGAIAMPSAQGTPAAPTSLVATSATKSAVALSWTSPDGSLTKFIVERKPLGASWTPPPAPAASPIVTTPVTGETMTDTSVGQFATYVYRVHAAGPNGAPGPASNEITVGPPPIGFSLVVAQPTDAGTFAHAVSATLDANGDPAMAYLFIDPDNNNDGSDSALHFVSWNRAKYRWNSPVKVAVVGDTEPNSPRMGICLVSDATTHQFALAHVTGTREVRLALSDDGVAWKGVPVEMVAEGSTTGEPTVAIDKGRVFLAYVRRDGLDRVPFRSADRCAGEVGPRGGAAAARHVQRQARGPAGGARRCRKPAVLYWLNPESGYNVTLALWRPQAKTVVKISDTNGEQSDVVDARIAFGGPRAFVAFHAHRTRSTGTTNTRSGWRRLPTTARRGPRPCRSRPMAGTAWGCLCHWRLTRRARQPWWPGTTAGTTAERSAATRNCSGRPRVRGRCAHPTPKDRRHAA